MLVGGWVGWLVVCWMGGRGEGVVAAAAFAGKLYLFLE